MTQGEEQRNAGKLPARIPAQVLCLSLHGLSGGQGGRDELLDGFGQFIRRDGFTFHFVQLDEDRIWMKQAQMRFVGRSPVHFFFSRNTNSPASAVDASSSWPVWRENA